MKNKIFFVKKIDSEIIECYRITEKVPSRHKYMIANYGYIITSYYYPSDTGKNEEFYIDINYTGSKLVGYKKERYNYLKETIISYIRNQKLNLLLNAK